MLLLSDTMIIFCSVLLLSVFMIFSYVIVKNIFEEKNIEEEEG